jgi:Secretion system C-terminal sorting domain
MKKLFLLLITGFLHCLIGNAQCNEKTWLVGATYLTQLTFNSNHIDTSLVPVNVLPVFGYYGLSEVWDTNRNMILYTNGAEIGNSNFQLIENGDSLTDSIVYNSYISMPANQTNLILHKRGSEYYVFNYSESDSLFEANFYAPDRLYYSIVDMSANGGMGKVTTKKKIAYKGVFGDNRLTACRHANGRDWWLIHQGLANDAYFKYLITPDSIYAPVIQHLGSSNFFYDSYGAQSCFSADGSKFATVSLFGPIEVMDFDRCTGTFSNVDSIIIPADTFYYRGLGYAFGYGAAGCCFSASGRFLYVCYAPKIIQYDMHAANIAQSATLIGEYDTTNGWNNFNQMYRCPTGQIIIDEYNGTGTRLHVIDSPDVQGLGCHFVFGGLPIPSLNAILLPNVINYCLGPLAGSACDTISTGIQELKAQESLSVYPNPTTERISISSGQNGGAELTIYDQVGRVVYRNNAFYSGSEVDIHSLSSGIYTLHLSSAGGEMQSRFVKLKE